MGISRLPQVDEEWYHRIMEGDIAGHTVVHKFGENPDVGTTFVPVVSNGIYRTPQTGDATTLRVKSGGNAADISGSGGAWAVTVQGLDWEGNLVSETLTTSGSSAGPAGSVLFMRTFRAYVSQCGTYASQTGGSHAADITIENSAGTEDWITLNSTDFPRAQTLVGAYTVPKNKTAYLYGINISVDSSKTSTVVLFKRENVLQTSPPYDGMPVQDEWVGIQGPLTIDYEIPVRFEELTDVGFMAKVNSTNASVSVDFTMLIVDDGAV